MARFLGLFLLITGLGAAVVIAMPSLVIFGLSRSSSLARC